MIDELKKKDEIISCLTQESEDIKLCSEEIGSYKGHSEKAKKSGKKNENEFNSLEMEKMKKEYEDRISIFSLENERLNSLMKLLINETDEWKIKYSKLEILIHEKSGIEGELRRIQDILQTKNREIEDWRNKHNSLEINIVELKSSQRKLFEYENKIAMLSQEIERNNSIISLKNEEIVGWKSKYFDSNEKVKINIFLYFYIFIKKKRYVN